MSVWRDILLKDLRELSSINYTRLNVIQQDLAERFMSEGLTRLEVFCLLNGMLNKEMVNKENAERYYDKNYGAIMDYEGLQGEQGE